MTTAEAKAIPPGCQRHVAWRLVGNGFIECTTCGYQATTELARVVSDANTAGDIVAMFAQNMLAEKRLR